MSSISMTVPQVRALAELVRDYHTGVAGSRVCDLDVTEAAHQSLDVVLWADGAEEPCPVSFSISVAGTVRQHARGLVPA